MRMRRWGAVGSRGRAPRGSWALLWLGLVAAGTVAGCNGGTPQHDDETGFNGSVGRTSRTVEIPEERLAEVHFTNVWNPVVNLSNLTIEQMWVVGGNLYITTPDSKRNFKFFKIDGDTGLTQWSYDLAYGRLEFQPSLYRYPKKLRSSRPDELWIVQRDRLHCLDDQEGVDNYAFDAGVPVSTPVAVSQEFVFTGSWNKRMYCFSKSKQLVQWSHITDAPITASAEVGTENVFFGSEDSSAFCLNMGAGFQYGKSWEQGTGGKIVTQPLYDTGRVFVGSWDYKLYCFDEYQGIVRWSYPTGAPITSSPFPFAAFLMIISTEERAGGKGKPTLHLVERDNGNARWEREGFERVLAADKFNCYALDTEKRIHALRLENGESAWQLDVSGFRFVAGQDAERGRRKDQWGRIYLASENGLIQAIRPIR